MTEVILKLENGDCYYPDGTHALKNVSLEIHSGKKIAVLGANGAGKSTLFLALNGILPLKNGKLFYNGKEITKKNMHSLRTKVGIVFQDPDSQIFSADLTQEIAFGPLNLGLEQQEVLKRVEEAMAVTDISDLVEKATHNLSYGQKKRVAIADILAMRPEILILDEPLAWLDPKHAQHTVQLLDKLAEQGKSIVVSTHDVNMAYAFAEYCIVLKHGEIIATGTTDEIFTDTKLLEEAELETPWIIKVLQESGLLKDSKPPKNIDELIKFLREAVEHD